MTVSIHNMIVNIIFINKLGITRIIIQTNKNVDLLKFIIYIEPH